MRLSQWLVLLVAMAIARAAPAQDVAGSTRLADVLDVLEAKHGVTFNYASLEVAEGRVGPMSLDADLDSALKQLMASDYAYKMIGDQILIRPQPQSMPPKHLEGKVLDNKGKALVGATVAIAGSSLGTYTDHDGSFFIEIPDEHQYADLAISYLGYQTARYTLVEDYGEMLLVELNEDEVSLAEVVFAGQAKSVRIVPNGSVVQLSQTFTNSQISGLAGSDLLRQIQKLCGIVAHDDTDAGIKIRGSNADETLLILDGMPIYNADHYFGIFSSVNTAFVDQVSIYKNYIPASYGGKTAGLVKLESPAECPTEVSGHVALDLLTGSAQIALPLTQRLFANIAFRSTWRDVAATNFNSFSPAAQRMEEIDRFDDIQRNNRIVPSFGFYDTNAKLDYRPNDHSRLSLHYFRSGDQLSVSNERAIRSRIGTRLESEDIESEEWQNEAASIQYEMTNDAGVKWSASAYTTHYSNEESAEIKIRKERPNENREQQFELVKQSNAVRDWSVEVRRNAGAWEIGTAFLTHDISYRNEDNGRQLDDFAGRPSEWAVFSSYGGQQGIFGWQLGLRGTYYSGNDRFYLSPRLSAHMAISDGWSIKAAAGRYQQFVRELNFEILGRSRDFWVYAGANGHEVLSNTSLMLGGHGVWGGLSIDVEGYIKYLENTQLYTALNPRRTMAGREYQLFIGDGISKGIDVTLGHSVGPWESNLAYTLSKVTQRYEAIDRGTSFPSEQDRRHQLKWLNSYTHGPFAFGADLIYSSGRPYPSLANLRADDDIRMQANRYRQLPHYLRLDMSCQYTIPVGESKLNLGLSVFNLLNRQNVNYIQSIASDIPQGPERVNTVIGNEGTLLPRTINAQISFSF